jgi:hypothetical protein
MTMIKVYDSALLLHRSGDAADVNSKLSSLNYDYSSKEMESNGVIGIRVAALGSISRVLHCTRAITSITLHFRTRIHSSRLPVESFIKESCLNVVNLAPVSVFLPFAFPIFALTKCHNMPAFMKLL